MFKDSNFQINKPTSKNTLGNIIEAQGHLKVENGKIIDKNKEIEKQERNEELKKMGYTPDGKILDKTKINSDPISGQKYSPQRLHADIDNENIINEFDKQNFLIEEEDSDNDDLYSFENENIQKYWQNKIKNKKSNIYKIRDVYEDRSEYSIGEIGQLEIMAREGFNEGNSHFIDSEKLSKEEILETIKEFRDYFPTKFTEMINHKILPNELGEFNWKEENDRDGKKQLVSYYPNKENYSIKYINKDYEFKNLDKVFVNGVYNQNKKNSKKESIIVFCSAPKSYKNKK
jgi:hypothetical protein